MSVILKVREKDYSGGQAEGWRLLGDLSRLRAFERPKQAAVND